MSNVKAKCHIFRLVLPLLLGAVACTFRPVVTAPPRDAHPEPPPTSRVAPTPTAVVPTATPEPAPLVPPPASLPSSDFEEPLVRVLLTRSSDAVSFPQPGRAYLASSREGSGWLWGPLTVTLESTTYYQIGAFADPGSLDSAENTLREAFGEDVEVIGEPAGNGVTRVRVRWIGPEPVGGAVAALAQLGYEGSFAVPGGGSVRISGASRSTFESNGVVMLEAAGDWPTTVGSRRYRGRFFLSESAGRLLVINTLNMEAYLRGVVPVEMGPSQFPELEALKAQTVAARTYAVAHLGDHEDEGFDLCATPACQAYHGAGAEHRLTDRAVKETAGLIATFGSEPIDAMYTSTCGGHTEDSTELFSGRGAPYLKGVTCEWERDLQLLGRAAADGPWMDTGDLEGEVALAALGLEPGEASPKAVLERVARMCGSRMQEPGRSADPRAFAEALLAAGGLETAARVFGRQDAEGAGLLAVTDLFGGELGPPVGTWTNGWHLRAALAVLEVQGVVSRDAGEAVPHPAGVAIYPRRAERSQPLTMPLPLWERWHDGARVKATAAVRPGTTLERIRKGDEVLALVVRRSGGDGEADRRSAWREWIREYEWNELARKLDMLDLERLEITDRARSGRVVGLAAHGRSGAIREWQGFPIRRALDLPENLFSFHLLTRPDGTRVVRFLGRGWGHGVGLCQNGSYGLARSGRSFADILKTYYTGIEIERWAGSRDKG